MLNKKYLKKKYLKKIMLKNMLNKNLMNNILLALTHPRGLSLKRKNKKKLTIY
jgi:hypothetical protein